MSTDSKQIKNTVPVGATSIPKYAATPIPKYATWDEHRDAIYQEAIARRTMMERRRVRTASTQGSLD